MMIYYSITMQSGKTPLAVAVDRNNPKAGSQLILASVDQKSDYQLWAVVFNASNIYNVGVVLINKATGMLAVPQGYDNGSPVVQMDMPKDGVIADKYVWQTNKADTNPSIRSIMALMAANQCLNAKGNSWGPNTRG